MCKKFLLLLLILVPVELWAQSLVSGTVFDFENQKLPLQEVQVKNINSGLSVKTKASGEFKLAAKAGDLLAFSRPGYHTDTMFLVDLSPKKVFLPVSSTTLKEVEISSAKVNGFLIPPDPEIKPMTRLQTDGLRGKKNNDRAGGLKFNLGYGKYKRQQEKLKEFEEIDLYENEIDKVFTEDYVADLTKLKGEDLKDFMSLYRPTLVLVKGERPFNYAYYTVKAYHTWLKLPAWQRKLPPVQKLKAN